MNKTAAKHGFTLIELIIVTAMIAVIGMATVGIVRNSYDDWKLDSSRSTLLQDGQAVVDQMARILRQAKAFYTVSDSSDQAGYVTFKSTDGITEEFRLNTGTDELEYGQPGNLSALTGAVTSLVFTIYDIDGNVLADPVQIGSVQSVQISATLTDPDDSSINFTYTSRVFCSTDYVRRLIGHWKMDESSGFTAADSGGYVNDGTLEDMNGNEWTAGLLGGALEFDGDNDYIDVGDVGDEIDVTKGTVSGWVELNSSSTTSTLFRAAADGNNFISLHWKADDSAFAMRYYANGVQKFVDIPSALIDEDDGKQHFVALTWDKATDEVKVFYDGAQYGSTQTGLGVFSGSIGTNVGIGMNKLDGIGNLAGMIDDVRVYNYALSDEEIADLADILRYREFTEAKAASDTTSLTISTPAGTEENDLLIAVVATDGDTSSSLAPPGGEGWTEINIGAQGSDVTLGAWWKNADASESATHEFTWTGDESAYGWMMRFTGHDTSDPIDDWAGNSGTSSTPTSPAVTTTNEYKIVLRLGAFDDSDITEDAPGLSGHMVITMDASASSGGESKMYWYDGEVDKIQRANLDGSSIEDVVTAGLEDLKVLAMDFAGGKMYWGDESIDKIQRANLDGSDIEDLVTAAALKPKALALDIAGGKMYWVDEQVLKIQRADLDGSNIEDVITIAGLKAKCLALDTAGGKMYWGDETYDKIQRANLDGSSIEDLVTAAAMKPIGLALDIVADPASGGAGYLSQSTVGGSGTSTFSLTESEESRTLTIAISPAP